jgi:hypothetical protein
MSGIASTSSEVSTLRLDLRFWLLAAAQLLEHKDPRSAVTTSRGEPAPNQVPILEKSPEQAR